MTPDSNCVLGAENRTRIDNMDGWMKQIAAKLERIANRPPVWATVVISLLMAALGVAVTLKINGG